MRNWLIAGSIAGLMVAGLGAATVAQAADSARPVHNYEVTPFAGYMAGGEFEDPADSTDRDLDADNNLGLLLNATAGGDYWRHYELLYSTQSTQLDGVTAPKLDMDVQYLQIGGTVSNPDAENVIPYFGLTIGATQLSPDESGLDDETKFSFTVGAGVRVPITDRIGVRFDARAFVTLLDSDGEIFCVSSGGATCRVRVSSDTFVQYAAALGLIIGF